MYYDTDADAWLVRDAVQLPDGRLCHVKSRAEAEAAAEAEGAHAGPSSDAAAAAADDDA